MNKFDVGRTISMLANVGVIAGIVFLGIEIHQNNQYLGMEARAQSAGRAVSMQNLILENPFLLEAAAKPRNQLNPLELAQMNILVRQFPVGWSTTYENSIQGAGVTFPLGAIRAVWHGSLNQHFEAAWPSVSQGYDSAFVEFMETNVIGAADE